MQPNNYGLPAFGADWGMPQMGFPAQQQNPGLSVNPLQPSPSLPQNAYGLDTFNFANVTQPNAGMFDWMKGAVGTKEAPGWGGMALGAASGLASAFMGMKQYGLAKETLAQNKAQFDMNYGAQKQMTNSSLEDRQRARVASNGGAYQSVNDYMATNGVR